MDKQKVCLFIFFASFLLILGGSLSMPLKAMGEEPVCPACKKRVPVVQNAHMQTEQIKEKLWGILFFMKIYKSMFKKLEQPSLLTQQNHTKKIGKISAALDKLIAMQRQIHEQQRKLSSKLEASTAN